MRPNDRTQFVDYCLRKLGHPVVKVSVADEQIQDRVDDAIQWWQEAHIEGSETAYFKHTLTQDEIDNKEISTEGIHPNILTITDILTIEGGGSNDKQLTRLWQFKASVHDLDFYGRSLTNYVIQMQYLSSMRNLLDNGIHLQFSRHRSTLKVNGINWEKAVAGQSYVVVEATVGLEESANIWNDRALKRYAAALIKKQWGENMKKYNDVVLVGGITMNGQQIWDEARDEIREIEEEINDTPLDFFIG